MSGSAKTFKMRLPATSANLGSGFDAAAVALNFFLEIEAEAAEEFSIIATGQDSKLCSLLKNNLILEAYGRILAENERHVRPLAIRMRNDIPLGMGCGSSAAGRLAAIALAVHFGELGWFSERILEEACALEGHPDNVAACWLGGFVAASNEGRRVHAARVAPQGLARDRGAAARFTGDQQGASDTPGKLYERRRGCEYSGCLLARPRVFPGPRRPAASGNARSNSPALSRRDVPDVAETPPFGRNRRNFGSQFERRRVGNPGDCGR